MHVPIPISARYCVLKSLRMGKGRQGHVELACTESHNREALYNGKQKVEEILLKTGKPLIALYV